MENSLVALVLDAKLSLRRLQKLVIKNSAPKRHFHIINHARIELASQNLDMAVKVLGD